MNSCNFVGKLINDPSLRYTQNGVACTTFTISVYNPFAKGDYKSDLVNIVVWQKSAEACANHLKKSSMCSVTARYSPRSYDNNEGRKVWVHEFTASDVRFLDGKSETKQDNHDPFTDDGRPIDVDPDQLPF